MRNAENNRHALECKFRDDYGRATLMALAGGLEAQFGTGLRPWHILEFRHGAD